jgi:glycine cleavage system H protein
MKTNKYYTPSHEWISIEGDLGTVGITDHAQKELGSVVFIELPKVGSRLSFGEEACILESTKAASDIYAPVSGSVIAVNEAIKAFPSQINQTAETSGWLFKLQLSNPSDLEHLLSKKQYEELISG